MQAVIWNEKPRALANLEMSDCPLLCSVLRKPKKISMNETGVGHLFKGNSSFQVGLSELFVV